MIQYLTKSHYIIYEPLVMLKIHMYYAFAFQQSWERAHKQQMDK